MHADEIEEERQRKINYSLQLKGRGPINRVDQPTKRHDWRLPELPTALLRPIPTNKEMKCPTDSGGNDQELGNEGEEDCNRGKRVRNRFNWERNGQSLLSLGMWKNGTDNNLIPDPELDKIIEDTREEQARRRNKRNSHKRSKLAWSIVPELVSRPYFSFRFDHNYA
ncbi:hypothetical protein V6N13_109708 [Hibiscus sabdariffa]